MTKSKINFNTTINKIINKIEKYESDKISLTAKCISESHFNGGKLFLFGTGHNHCLAEEGLHRAGGYANACPILDDNINFAKGIKKASKSERTAGVSKSLLKKQEINEAISFTEPNLPMGIVFRISSMPVLPSILCVRSVSIKPGETELTNILKLLSSADIAAVRPSKPNLDAE